jgi:predicted ABC-type ATPase
VDPRPSVVVVAGPNGAGKSTVAAFLLPPLGVTEFVNADVIAAEQAPGHPQSAALSAGREMLTRLRHLAVRRVSFAFETTLASRHFAPWLADLIAGGYTLHILFVWLPSADVAVRRVQRRVVAGGHDVPEGIVRRRYERGLFNFFDLYQSLAATWRIYDNSVGRVPGLIAAGTGRTPTAVVDHDTWNRIQRGAHGRS